MAEQLRVLFVNQEIEPYVVGTQMGSMGVKYPQTAQEEGYEVRAFMPKFGVINERRNQLHEVIRLSGLNLVIAGGDHPLIIKVASLQALRLQVYFIDNEDFFLRRGITNDELGVPYPDNDQRAQFFAKGVLETVKKLRWIPDLIHCGGWFSAFIPFLVRTHYQNDPTFSRSKILYTLYEDDLNEALGDVPELLFKSLKVSDEDREFILANTHESITQLAIRYSDAVSFGETEASVELREYAQEQGKVLFDLRLLENLDGVYKNILYGSKDAE